MNAARRSKRRRDWPAHLYEEKDGYYTFRYMKDGKSTRLIIGRKPLNVAINEAIAANLHLANAQPDLVAQLKGAAHTIGDVIGRMVPPKAKQSQVSYRSWDNEIRQHLGTRLCSQLTVEDCAKLIDDIHASGRETTAKCVRSRLTAICRKAQQLGWMALGANPASVTAEPVVEVRRTRLTLETFWKIHAAAPEVADWLQHAMMLALVTGQDVSTVCAMERSHVKNGELIVWRKKTRRTNAPVAIPLALRLEVAGVSLGELVAGLVARKIGVGSKYLVHYTTARPGVRAGAPLTPHGVSRAFKLARQRAGIKGANPPTFHEIRSLSKRLYLLQGGVDTKALLGHTSDSTAALYADPRGIEPIRVRIS